MAIETRELKYDEFYLAGKLWKQPSMDLSGVSLVFSFTFLFNPLPPCRELRSRIYLYRGEKVRDETVYRPLRVSTFG